jgi:hypothetical protein
MLQIHHLGLNRVIIYDQGQYFAAYKQLPPTSFNSFPNGIRTLRSFLLGIDLYGHHSHRHLVSSKFDTSPAPNVILIIVKVKNVSLVIFCLTWPFTVAGLGGRN